MDKRSTATLTQRGETLFVTTPYCASFIAELKAAIPVQDREWKTPNWEVAVQHRDAVRRIISSFAAQQGWELLDHTVLTQDEIEKKKAALEESRLEAHVRAVLEVFPKLPPRSLALVEWTRDALVLELQTYLDDAALFRELCQASLEAYRPTILYGGMHKRTFKQTFVLASDERLIRALCTLAGPAPTGLSSSGVEYLHVQSTLSLRETFEHNRIAHMVSGDGNAWVGELYQYADVASWTWSLRPWQLAPTDLGVYVVFPQHDLINEFLSDPGWSYINPGSGFMVAPPERPSQVAWLVKHLHLETQFREWSTQLVEQTTLIPNALLARRGPLWREEYWNHPADILLKHLSRVSRLGVVDVLHLLEWTQDFVAERIASIAQLKRIAVEQVLNNLRENARDLARPLLEARTVAELRALAEGHGIAVKKSSTKQLLVEKLLEEPALSEEVIGLTQQLQARAVKEGNTMYA